MHAGMLKKLFPFRHRGHYHVAVFQWSGRRELNTGSVSVIEGEASGLQPDLPELRLLLFPYSPAMTQWRLGDL
jgi:hypothetical protein